MKQILKVISISKSYQQTTGFFRKKNKTVNALSDINFELFEGEILALVGESGSGKSTFAKIFAGLIAPDGGEIQYKNKDLLKNYLQYNLATRKEIQMIFQDPFSSLDPKMNIAEILAEPLEIHHFGTKLEIKQRVIDYIKLIGLDEQDLKKYPHQFSGGQRQRICIARALILNPKVVICDEPVSALDVSIQAQILELLKELQKKLGLTLLFITHDLRVVKYLCSRVIVLNKGKIVESGTVKQIFSKPKDSYTKSLLNSVPGKNLN